MFPVEFSDPDGVRWAPERPTGTGVLVLAGSSGRIDTDRARIFAEHGCLAESTRWFGGTGQHTSPWEIPLETFFQRIDWLKTECDRVWVAGTSFGSEAALLVGALSDDVAEVIAFAPSDVVWAGYDGDRETSHWTLRGQALPYVPFDWNEHVAQTPAHFRPLYEKSWSTAGHAATTARIPVEHINRLVLVAGGDDQVWPSVAHAQRIVAHRAQAGLVTQLIVHPHAGHRTILPGEHPVTTGATMMRGGNENADRELGSQAWPVILNELTTTR
ncbi:acyl-CoA thioester hydrolase/BAAT C-terminal domain-containing protein [Rudaeicoccus suwonensis]|uniref:acyl-CoA thioester hydrolase/BAAT C-terminal domain-containing protein n=1 Tax=Rudaeicoccus suwonensis TaxID=657409 RepID=UPI0014771099|nr:acyl-CoA thioester hydrolase/BAAT C-terminal domain-containing protein [Rudaeicoccus suwonensis]